MKEQSIPEDNGSELLLSEEDTIEPKTMPFYVCLRAIMRELNVIRFTLEKIEQKL